MKFLILITCVLVTFSLFTSKTSNAQTSTFKLSDYKNPEYLYQTLDLNFGLNSGLLVINHSSNETDSKSNISSFSLNSEAGVAYSYFKNSPKTQAEKHISLNAGIGSSSFKNKQGEYDFTYKSGSFNHAENLNIMALKRFYNEKQQYFEVNGTLSGMYNGISDHGEGMNADTITTKNRDSHKNLNLNLTGAFLVGKGRIEQVQDARLAMYILEDLQKLDREKRLASDEDVLALAKEITLLKYKRFFDNRLRKIAEITAIDAFLQKNGIAGTSDAAYFTSLNDNWDFANNPVRYSGKRMFTGFEANFGSQYRNALNEYLVPTSEPDEYTYKQTNSGLFLVAGIDFEKPKSLSWQNSASVKIGVGIKSHLETEKIPDIMDETKYYIWALPTAKLTADYGFGYYPNSRTWLTFRWWLTSGWDKEMDGDTRDNKQDFQNSFYTYSGPQFNAYYYLSEKLRLSLTFNGELKIDKHNYTYEVIEGEPDKYTSSIWNHQLIAALMYSLF